MTDSSTAEATGDEGLTIAQAAEAFMAMEPDEGQTGDETQGREVQTESDDEPEDNTEGADDEEPSDEGEEDADDSQEEPDLIPVKVNGEEVKVTLDELKKGYSRTEDYRRKTTALAEERTAFQGEKAAISAEREQYKTVLGYWAEQLNQPLYDPAETENLRSIDPGEYAARMAQEAQRREALAANQAEQTRLANEAATERAKAQKASMATAEAQLLDAVPEWKADPKKYGEGLKAMFDYAGTLGISPGDILENADHRHLLILRDAAAYRALQAKKPAVQQQLAKVKTAKPGTQAQQPSKVTEITRAKQRLAKTGSTDDAAAIFMLREPPT